MGLSNEATLAGHIGLNLDWSGGQQGARERKEPPGGRTTFLDDIFSRPHTAGSTWSLGAVMGPNTYLNIITALRKAGFPENIILTYALAQVSHETDGGVSNFAQSNNNYSGIKYVGQPEATGSSTGKVGGYAMYDSIDNWARDYKRVLSMNKGAGAPIDATTAQQFYIRLLKNGYFLPKEGPKYAAAFNVRLKQINALTNSPKLAAAIKQTKQDIADKGNRGGPPGPGVFSIFTYIKAHPMLTGVGLTFIGIIGLKAITHR